MKEVGNRMTISDNLTKYKLLSLYLAIKMPLLMGMNDRQIHFKDLDENNLAISIPASKIIGNSLTCKIELLYDNEGFVVIREGKCIRVPKSNVEKLLKKCDFRTMLKYAILSKFKVKELEDGQYLIKTYGGLKKY